ncbi:MAG: hypothetical protein KC609_15145 [Myxococcales bacterium]|nr:hypothetical protein [Myxococcales bacterium]
MRITIATLLLGFTLILAPLTARAEDEPPALSEVRALLLGIDTLPSKAAFEKISPDVHRLLIRLAGDVNEHGYVRERATGYLGFFRDHRSVLEKLRSLAEMGPLGLRKIAILTIGHAFRSQRQVESADFVARFLNSRDEELREAALRSLSFIRHSRALALLRAHRDANPRLERLRLQRVGRLARLLATKKAVVKPAVNK